MKASCLQSRFEFLLGLIKHEGLHLRNAVQHHPKFQVTYKGHDDLVTQFDLETEKHLMEAIQKNFPTDLFLSEETHDDIRTLEGITWIIDPIDGTTNFVHGYPVFCISIAIALDTSVMCGAIFNPMQDELYFAYKDAGAYLNNHRLSPIGARSYSKALLVTGFPYRKKVSANQLRLAIELFCRFQSTTQAVRRDGSAALDLCYVAAGRFTGFFETGLHPWDVAAGMLISSEVGAIHLNFSGNPTDIFGKELICAHPDLAKEIVKEIQALGTSA